MRLLTLALAILCTLALPPAATSPTAQTPQTPQNAPTPADPASIPKEAPLRLLTFNVRYENSGDGDNAWANRKDEVAALIRRHDVDAAGLQEVLANQLADLDERLPGYAHMGVGRDDGRKAGEFSPILYRKARLECRRSGTFWLSETPDRPGLGWDAACPRIVTWAEMRDLATGADLFLFNTHFDHRGETARRESARLVLRRIHDIAGNAPVVLLGDFNADTGSEPYRILTGNVAETKPDGAPPVLLRDARDVCTAPHEGPKTTWNGFAIAYDPAGPEIDHVFVSPGIRVQRHATLADSIEDSTDERRVSDHFPVLVEITLD